MPKVKIGRKHQVTIPKEVFEELELEEGEYVEVKAKREGSSDSPGDDTKRSGLVLERRVAKKGTRSGRRH